MQSETGTDPGGAQQSRYDRLKQAFEFATQRVEPGSEVLYALCHIAALRCKGLLCRA